MGISREDCGHEFITLFGPPHTGTFLQIWAHGHPFFFLCCMSSIQSFVSWVYLWTPLGFIPQHLFLAAEAGPLSRPRVATVGHKTNVPKAVLAGMGRHRLLTATTMRATWRGSGAPAPAATANSWRPGSARFPPPVLRTCPPPHLCILPP